MGRDERAVREQVIQELEVRAQKVPLELGKVGLDVLVEHDELASETFLRSSGASGCMVLDDLLGERQVAVALEALADPVDVQLRDTPLRSCQRVP